MRSMFVAVGMAITMAAGAAALATGDAEAKKDCICADGYCYGNGNGFRAPKKVRELAASLALAAVHSGAMDNMDSEALADYAIDVAKRVAYADLYPFEPTDEP